MIFQRSDYNDDIARLRRAPNAEDRARGDNFAFEENVGPDRLAHFEGLSPRPAGLRTAAAQYFNRSVQGTRRTHVPSTFQEMNRPAQLPSIPELVQKIVRLERIDGVLQATNTDFTTLEKDVSSSGRAAGVIEPFLRGFEMFSGARPAFACFRAEVAMDLKQPDWLDRLCARLGLGHWTLADGETAHFALMEYTVQQVVEQATVSQPFARPTVLECQDSEFFFPAPAGSGEGYAVDLEPAAGRNSIREFLHVRIQYHTDHLKRVARRQGPTLAVDLPAARDAHLTRLRARCGRDDFGDLMVTAGSPAA